MAKKKFTSYSTNSLSATESGKIYDLEVIRQDILNTVWTRKGEYPIDLKRGMIVHDYVFSPMLNEVEKSIIIEDTKAQLAEDPRFEVRDVRVFSEDDNHAIVLYIDLFVPPLNEELNLKIDIEE